MKIHQCILIQDPLISSSHKKRDSFFWAWTTIRPEGVIQWWVAYYISNIRVVMRGFRVHLLSITETVKRIWNWSCQPFEEIVRTGDGWYSPLTSNTMFPGHMLGSALCTSLLHAQTQHFLLRLDSTEIPLLHIQRRILHKYLACVRYFKIWKYAFGNVASGTEKKVEELVTFSYPNKVELTPEAQNWIVLWPEKSFVVIGDFVECTRETNRSG